MNSSLESLSKKDFWAPLNQGCRVFRSAGLQLKDVNRKRCRGLVTKAGFTLLELLIVLVLMTMILAIAWPQINRKVARSQLKQVAIDLQDNFSEARRQAIQSGRAYGVRFSENGRGYQIIPLDLVRQSQATDESKYETIEISPDNALESSEKYVWTESVELDDTIQIVEGSVESNLSESETIGSPAQTIAIGDNAPEPDDKNVWSIPVYPDGRSENTTLQIVDRTRRIALTLEIRGLTGQVEIGQISVLDSSLIMSESTQEVDDSIESFESSLDSISSSGGLYD